LEFPLAKLVNAKFQLPALSIEDEMADAATLRAELDELEAKIARAQAVEEAKAEREGRPFSIESFTKGFAAKYPNGPAFLPYPSKPTLLNLTLGISFRDMAATALGAAAFYGLGFQHGEQRPISRRAISHCILPCLISSSFFGVFAAPKLGIPRLSGHRLGMALTIPVLFVGYSAGLQKSLARHWGFIDNGRECIYGEGYKRDSTVPYFVRHEVSDRRR
jgi:hypothetical protein